MGLKNTDIFPTYIAKQERSVLITDAVIKNITVDSSVCSKSISADEVAVNCLENPLKKSDSLNIYPPIIDIMFIGV